MNTYLLPFVFLVDFFFWGGGGGQGEGGGEYVI